MDISHLLIFLMVYASIYFNKNNKIIFKFMLRSLRIEKTNAKCFQNINCEMFFFLEGEQLKFCKDRLV